MLELFILDIIPAAPPAADNNSVLLWVVTVLTGVLGLAVVYMARKVKVNEDRCLTNEAQCKKDNDAMHAQIEALLRGVIADQHTSAQRQCSLMEAVKVALDRNTDAVEKGSGIHPKVERPR